MALAEAPVTGRRKCAVARVQVKPGSGNITVNGISMPDYFGRRALQLIVQEPLRVTDSLGKFDVIAIVRGGGPTGQAGAVRHAIARSLAALDENYRQLLKKAGLLTRDPRMKERRKYGLKKARKAPQYSKR
ncbi:MAG TPA: 30S ribosomal protein S9 [Firmicutes bacterium]|nr:30S ribosomal protein S9 [Bacillota bacterium]